MATEGDERSTKLLSSQAQSCLNALRGCTTSAESVIPRMASHVEDELIKFSLWASSIGVFLLGRAALDHRLREVHRVRSALGGLLESLESHALECNGVLDNLAKPGGNFNSDDENLKEMHECLEEIKADMGQLHRLSDTVRRAVKKAHERNVSSFEIRDDDGNDVEEHLKIIFANHLRDKYPDSTPNIRDRLAKTMLLQRRKIIYRRWHHAKATQQLVPKVSQASHENTAATGSLNHDSLIPTRTTAQDNSNHFPTLLGFPNASPRIGTYTTITLNTADFPKSLGRSEYSTSQTVALDDYRVLPFPPVPSGKFLRSLIKRRLRQDEEIKHGAIYSSMKATDQTEQRGTRTEELKTNQTRRRRTRTEAVKFTGEVLSGSSLIKTPRDDDAQTIQESLYETKEVTCPFCFQVLPLEDVYVDSKWKAHVLSDLDPYVCLFENCDQPEKVYKHSREWIKHQQRHNTRWTCISRIHKDQVYRTKEEYVDHMNTSHCDLDEAMVNIMAEQSARTNGPLFQSCPLCMCEVESPEAKDTGVGKINGSMEEHLIGHMLLVALKSLPGYEDDVEEDDETASLQRISARIRPLSRSTIADDSNDKHSPVEFDGGPGNQTDTGPCHDQHSSYEAYGGFRNYIKKFPGGRRISPSAKPTESQETPEFFPAEASSAIQNSHDPSCDFVEDSLFDGVAAQERRDFEWGFIKKTDPTTGDVNHDPILKSFLHRKVQ